MMDMPVQLDVCRSVPDSELPHDVALLPSANMDLANRRKNERGRESVGPHATIEALGF